MESIDRRTFISSLIASAALSSGSLSCFIQNVMAMSSKNYPQGMRKIKGDVKINGKNAQIGDIVNQGDIVTTGSPESLAVFVAGKDAYLLRSNTQIKIETDDSVTNKIQDILHVVNGKVLAVFSKSRKRIITSTAVLGIRGTGMYLEAEDRRSYICACYGDFDLKAKALGDIKEHFQSKHHENARYIYASGKSDKIIVKAKMKNHTDAELIMLEALVGRKPPFLKNWSEDKKYKGSSGNEGY